MPFFSRSSRLSPDYWKFWTGQTISNFGSSFTMFALPLLVYKLTGSGINLALATAANFLPYLLFGLIIGAWVDRLDRKRLMIATDVTRALIVSSIPILALAGLLNVWVIYAVGFFQSALAICFNSAEFAALPSLVGRRDDLVAANGQIQASYSAATVAGPLAAGLLVAFIPLPTLLFLDAASFLVSAGSLSLIGVRFNVESPRARTKIRSDIAEGLRYVLSHPVLRAISIMMALVNIVQTTRYSQFVLFAKQRLLSTDTELGVLFAAGSVGVVVLSLAAGRLRKRFSFSQAALGALMLLGVLTVALAFSTSFWVALPIWTLTGGLGIFFNINTQSLRQAIVPNHLLGRVTSVAQVLAWSAIPLGAFAGGVAIDWTRNVVLVYAVVGVLAFLIPFGFSFTALGHAERYLPEEAAAAPARS